MLASQLQLGELFEKLGQRSPELRDEFGCNAASHRALHESGRPLREALVFFVSSVQTLCEQTIEDTLATVRQYEAARVEYDAYRADLEWAQQQSQAPAGAPALLAEAQRQHDLRRAEYERLREKVSVKLRLLDENRVKVMQNQLILFHKAVSNFFSGNSVAVKATLAHLSAMSLGAGDGSTAGRPGAA
ncbi:arfaptin-2-like [Pollicipes pollicipes]|nr:arfaptin-2-like [Pollicipes pollicipes]